jgi:hypothetical protein
MIHLSQPNNEVAIPSPAEVHALWQEDSYQLALLLSKLSIVQRRALAVEYHAWLNRDDLSFTDVIDGLQCLMCQI